MQMTVEIPVDNDEKIKAHITTPDLDEMVGLDALLIIMAHDFPGNKDGQDDVFKDLGFLLKGKGFHSLAPDFRGCGESSGEQEDFTLASARCDLKAILNWAKEEGYERFMFVGEGLGASLPLMDFNDEAVCFILLWAILDFPYTAQHAYDSKNIGEQWKKAGYIVQDSNRIGTSFIHELETTDIVSTLKHTDRPLLVMHGAQDTVAPIDRLDFLREHVASQRVEITSFQDGEYGLSALNHRKAMHYHILQFIEKYAALV